MGGLCNPPRCKGLRLKSSLYPLKEGGECWGVPLPHQWGPYEHKPPSCYTLFFHPNLFRYIDLRNLTPRLSDSMFLRLWGDSFAPPLLCTYVDPQRPNPPTYNHLRLCPSSKEVPLLPPIDLLWGGYNALPSPSHPRGYPALWGVW